MRTGLWVLLVGLSLVSLGCRPPTRAVAPPKGATAAATNVGEAAQAFVRLLAKGDYAAAVKPFDAAMARAMPASRMKQTWEGLVAEVGPFQQQTGLQQRPEGPYTLVFVTCRFQKASLDVKVVFDAQQRIGGLWFVAAGSGQPYQPPTYVDAASFNETEVVVGQGKWALPGTLAMPKGKGPFPAAVLVHGSGPEDRDETIGPNKPFRDLAWGLASHGIAVLRYEKRTKAHQAEMAAALKDLTVREETIGDALSAVALLRKTKGVDPRRVFVLGHSLGGMLIPRIALAGQGMAGYIIMAGTNRPLEDAMVEQLEYIASLPGPQGDGARKQLPQVRAAAEKVKDPKLSPQSPSLLGGPAVYWLDLRAYHPLEAVRQVKQPMLVLQGGRDYQSTTVDFERWQKALAGRTDVTCRLYPDLNHLFAEGKGKAVPAEYEQPGHVSAQVIADLAQWITRQPPR